MSDNAKEENTLRSRGKSKEADKVEQPTEKKEDVKEEVEVDDGEDEQIKRIARKVLIVFVCIIVVAFLCLYFYWGILLSKRLTFYLLSRDAWNFDFWPFEGMRRPPMPRRPRVRK